VTLQVPPLAVPAPVVAGLQDAGFQVSAGAAPADLAVNVPAAPAAVVPPSVSVAIEPAQSAPAGLVPQDAAAANPDLAAANAAAWQRLAEFGQAADAFFQQAAANPPPADMAAFATWAAAQQQAVLDYFGGM
jgi:hypothetical protein